MEPKDDAHSSDWYDAATMQVFLVILALVAVTLMAPLDDASSIEIGATDDAVAWTVELQDRETA